MLTFGIATANASGVGEHSKAVDKAIDEVYNNNFTHFDRSISILHSLRGKISESETNKIEGDLYYNRGNSFEALKFYKRAFYDQAVEDDAAFRMKLAKKILMCYDYTHNFQEMSYYSHVLNAMATKANDTAMIAASLFNEGKIAHHYNHNRGNELVRSAINMMMKSNGEGRDDEIYYYYITLIEQLTADHSNHEGLKECDALLAFCRHAKDGMGGIMANDQRRIVDINVHRAVLLSRLGHRAEAHDCYQQFVNSKDVYEYDYARILIYLEENNMSHEIISLLSRPNSPLAHADANSSDDLSTICKALGDAYYNIGDYAKAASVYQRLDSLRQQMLTREEQSAVNEMTNNYESKQLALEEEQKIGRLRARWILAVALIIIIGIGIIVIRERRNNKIILEKNRWMAHLIEQLQKAQTTASGSERNEKKDSNENEGASDTDKILFDRLSKRIVEDKLYLNTDLKRDHLLDELGIPKNKFSMLFKRYAGTTYTNYINNLRLDDACKVMNEHPNYTIEAVASECGIASVSTLYNLFSKRYGMTPSEYRSVIKADSKQEKDTNN